MSVRNGIVLLLALSTLTLLVGCGGSSSPKPNPVGFSQGNLSGTYVFSSTGADGNGGLLAAAGTVVANGSGGITGGTMDVIGVDFVPPVPVAQAITSGSYTVGSDGRGQATLTSSAGTIVLDFVLTSSSHGLVTEFDSGTGSGTIDLQTAVTSLSQLQGPYAFSFAGVDASLTNTFATVGAFTLDTTGDVTAGVEDFNDAGIPYLNQSLSDSVAATLGSGTGPGTITFTTTFGALTFDFYPIDATHLKFIETDSNEFLAGDAFTQTGASIPTGPMAFTMAGGSLATGPIAVGGVMTSDGTGNFTGGLEDVNDNGTISVAPVPFTGTAAAGGSVGGRVIVNLTGFVPATQWVIYPSSGGLLMLETDSATVTVGAGYAQTSQTFAASQNYGLNLSAVNTGNGSGSFEEDDIAQFTTTSTGFSGIVDINDEGSTSFDQSFSGTYTAPDSTGRGTATTTANNNQFVSFTFYVVDSSTVLLLETDSNQIGTGTIELQSAPAAHAAARSAVSLVRPILRAHTALRRK
jgi:hypothetical protein